VKGTLGKEKENGVRETMSYIEIVRSRKVEMNIRIEIKLTPPRTMGQP
jgi:hypothetical protein